MDRREFLRDWIRNGALAMLAVFTGSMFASKRVLACGKRSCNGCPKLANCPESNAVSARKIRGDNTVWQLDPEKCVQCGQCATECVLNPSAVKCMHAFVMCGYCKLCFGYFKPGVKTLNEGAENQLCPTGALKRKFIEPPYYQYTIDKTLCIGCAKCVAGCAAFGNGSLFLQVNHDLCLNCNECSIARHCPADAFSKVPLADAYLTKGETEA